MAPGQRVASIFERRCTTAFREAAKTCGAVPDLTRQASPPQRHVVEAVQFVLDFPVIAYDLQKCFRIRLLSGQTGDPVFEFQWQATDRAEFSAGAVTSKGLCCSARPTASWG